MILNFSDASIKSRAAGKSGPSIIPRPAPRYHRMDSPQAGDPPSLFGFSQVFLDPFLLNLLEPNEDIIFLVQ